MRQQWEVCCVCTCTYTCAVAYFAFVSAFPASSTADVLSAMAASSSFHWADFSWAGTSRYKHTHKYLNISKHVLRIAKTQYEWSWATLEAHSKEVGVACTSASMATFNLLVWRVIACRAASWAPMASSVAFADDASESSRLVETAAKPQEVQASATCAERTRLSGSDTLDRNSPTGSGFLVNYNW